MQNKFFTCQCAPWHFYTPGWVWAPGRLAACAAVQKLSTAAEPDLPEAHTANWQRQREGADGRMGGRCVIAGMSAQHTSAQVTTAAWNQKPLKYCKYFVCSYHAHTYITWHLWMSCPLHWGGSPSATQTASGVSWVLFPPVGQHSIRTKIIFIGFLLFCFCIVIIKKLDSSGIALCPHCSKQHVLCSNKKRQEQVMVSKAVLFNSKECVMNNTVNNAAKWTVIYTNT